MFVLEIYKAVGELSSPLGKLSYSCSIIVVSRIADMKTTNMLVRVDEHENPTQSENEFIHEHELVRARVEETAGFCVQCISCGIYYCDLCGKTLENINRGFTNEKI
jgi:hypothetical protein